MNAGPNGTGLGLAIVAQQAALHGGELRLGDSSRGGLGVEVRLPLSNVAEGKLDEVNLPGRRNP